MQNDQNYQDILSRVNKPDSSSEFDYKDDSMFLKISQGKVYLGSKEVGISKGVSDRIIHFREEFSLSVIKAYEVFACCLSPETSSSSPSKMFHQLCSISLSVAISLPTVFEDLSFNYTPDLVIKSVDSTICLDIGSNLKLKSKVVPDNIKLILINKYLLISPQNNILNILIEWSRANDEKDSSFIYDKILKQSNGNEMLYSEEMIKFFLNKSKNANLSIHSKCAKAAFSEIIKEHKSDETYHDPNKVVIQILRQSYEKHNKISDLQNSYFIFPQKTNISSDIFIKFDDEDMPADTEIKTDEYESVDGILRNKTLDINQNKGKELYSKERQMLLHTKAYLSLLHYPTDKTEKMMLAKETFLKLCNYFKSSDKAWQTLIANKFYEKLQIPVLPGHSKTKIHHNHKNYKEAVQMEEKEMRVDRCLMPDEDIDPDHLRLLKESSNEDLIKLISTSRDYFEMRMKSRISLAIIMNRKPKRCFKVNHWKYKNLYALCKIEGLILNKDMGVVYVSYFHNDNLYRTDKWRLPDVENFSVAHHRYVASLMSYKSVCKRTPGQLVSMIYARILTENSWGLSKFLKVYRYLSSGICMRSPSITDTCKKLAETINDQIGSKLSFKLMMLALFRNAKNGSLQYGRTPIFQLEFENLGFESFLVNLCPSNTYGKASHLESTISELADEIDLFNSKFAEIKSIYTDFEKIIKSHDHDHLTQKYYNHFKFQLKVSSITSGRFTFSPASVLVTKECISELTKTMRIKENLNSCPPLTSLMTAKASTMSRTGKPAMAIETINDLSNKYKTTSTSLIALRILNRLTEGSLIDLEMRMFDKDQVGGDREISILSGEYRVLQAIAEKFFQNLARHTKIDKLHDPNKRRDLFDSYERSTDSPTSICLTADQTRWGPNFNTLIFGLISLLFADLTTEFFLPSIISFICEFKVFEMPSWVLNCLKRSDYIYSLPGKLGRNHMGQGIHHQSSSFWHSLVIMTKVMIIRDDFNLNNPQDDNVALEIDSFITSDDLGMLAYYTVKSNDKYHEDGEFYTNFIIKIEESFKTIGPYLIHFGILTSKYKNIVSKSIEFNQDHLGENKIASVDLKFVYSLIDPATTGNFYHDFNMIFDNYINALNSLCRPEVAKVISWMTLVKTSRQWKINISNIRLPSESLLRAGVPKILNLEEADSPDDPRFLNIETNLHYRTRKAMELRTASNMQEAILNSSLRAMVGTRERSAYRSILTYAKRDYLTVASDYFLRNELIGESYSVFMKNMLDDSTHIDSILNKDLQTTFMSYPEQRKTKKGLIKTLLIRDPVNVKYELLDVVVSHYPKMNYMGRNRDQIMLHLLRNHCKLRIEAPLFDYEKTDLVTAISIVDVKIKDLDMLSTACKMVICTGDRAEIEYTRYVYMLPKQLQLYKRIYNFRSSTSFPLLLPNTNYISGKQNLYYLSGSVSNIELKQPGMGHVLPHLDLITTEEDLVSREMVSLAPIKHLMINEPKYRKTFYINFTTKQRLLTTSHHELQGITSEEILELDRMIDQDMNFNFDDINFQFDDDDEVKNEEDDIGDISLEEKKEPINLFSTSLDTDLGFLCDGVWALNILIGFTLIMTLLRNKVIKQLKLSDDLNPLELSKYKIVTVDPNFPTTFRRILAESSINIKNEMHKLEKPDYNLIIYRLLTNELTDYDILELLCGKVPTISFTSEPKGKIISKEEMVEMLV